MTKVAIVTGDSPERAVSLRSANAVAKAAQQAGFYVQFCDLKEQPNALDGLRDDTVILPIAHGSGWEDGVIQKVLEQRGLKYLGSDSHASHDSFDKAVFRERMVAEGIPVAQGVTASRDNYRSQEIAKWPHVLKVARGGSSIGTMIVRDPAQVTDAQLDELFQLDDKAVLEEFIKGVEITVPLLDGHDLPVIEIRPPEGGEFDYENKYNGQTAELIPPVSISADQADQAIELAKHVHTVMGCRHLSRVDIIVRADGSMVVLEVNTIPGMTDQSLFPKAAAAAGLPMPELVKEFVKLIQNGANA